MSSRWRIELFGSLRAVQGGRSITRFRTQKTGALLAYLAYHGGRAHPREELIELLWPEGELEAGGTASRRRSPRCATSWRGLVGSGAVIVADRQQVGVNARGVETDVEEFEGLVGGAGWES